MRRAVVSDARRVMLRGHFLYMPQQEAHLGLMDPSFWNKLAACTTDPGLWAKFDPGIQDLGIRNPRFLDHGPKDHGFHRSDNPGSRDHGCLAHDPGFTFDMVWDPLSCYMMIELDTCSQGAEHMEFPRKGCVAHQKPIFSPRTNAP